MCGMHVLLLVLLVCKAPSHSSPAAGALKATPGEPVYVLQLCVYPSTACPPSVLLCYGRWNRVKCGMGTLTP
ncbi:hypothetical protein BDW22DRAFT_1354573 [Trametopsis cervina]|nr:hypothetical protein BDW22DRAFT_1354572 [Trametopsis cervina]KAI0344503.1 hypothetical protein BDW22DRAFT_1354573 [Trametopsis cervina]